MQLITDSTDSPELNLAIDEALLLEAEKETGRESIRFWSTDRRFVVLGYSRSAIDDAHVQRCRQDGVPILRRYSGGGTVLQGPGCLNYSLVLRINGNDSFSTIAGTTRAILDRHARALAPFLHGNVSIEGISDLAVGGKKFSGNAQRRLKTCVLFHGTVLLDFDLSTLERYLREPGRQPAYRRNRNHADFVTNIPLTPALVRDLLASAWNAGGPPAEPPLPLARRLVRERYAREEWNWKR